jgi:hypothetical protein
MNAAMILFDSSLREEVFMIMKLSEIINYTLFHGLHGSGNQGKKEGSITWPGTNEILMVLADEDGYKRLKETISRYKKEKGESHLLLFQWAINEVIV